MGVKRQVPLHEPMEHAPDARTYAIIGAAMEVHRILGRGFLEKVYGNCFAIELRLRGLPYRREVDLPVYYKGIDAECTYRCDFVCDGVIVELKALQALGGHEESQLINYLKAGTQDTGLLINFGAKSLQFRRFVATDGRQPALTAEANLPTMA